MTRTQRRIVAPALALVIALAGTLLAPSIASAAGRYDGKVVISQGHLDLFYSTLVDGQPVLQVNDDTGSPGHVLRPADDVVVHVRPAVDGRAANAYIANGIPGFTSVGATIYVLPQTNILGRIFAGFGYSIPEAPTSASVTYQIVGYDGPGNFATWQAGDEAPIPFLNSTVAGSSFTSLANHEHMAWGFTAEGEYRVTVQAAVTLPGDAAARLAEPVTYTFWVGDELPDDGGSTDPEVSLSISGLVAHYHTGEIATLTAVQDPATDEDHYHWFTRPAGATDWTVVAGALGSTYGTVVRGADHGTEVMVRLYDHDHQVIAESPAVTLLVDDHGNPPVEGPVITTELPADAGSLVISVDEANRDVRLTDLALNPAADRYVATGAVGGIRVTDTRPGDLGWTANGRVRAFTTVDGDVLGGSNMGWTPEVLAASAGQTVTAGGAVAPALSGGPGVGGWSLLGQGATGASRGAAVLGADLRLEAPLTLEPGTYQGLLILTVI